MKIFAMDTSSFPASAAIAEDGILLGEYIMRSERRHSQHIMVMTERLFEDTAVDLSDIDLFAVTIGPGSFTGLRIGISSVRALAQAAGKPALAVNSLEALAYNFACCEATVIPMLDARRGEVFTAAYKFNGGEAEELMAPYAEDVISVAKRYAGKGFIYAGDGAMLHRDKILSVDETAVFPPLNLSEIHSSAAAAAAAVKAKKGEILSYNEIQPLYLRKSQAEREYDNKKGIQLK